jgi:hypothetical protein
MQNSFYPYLFQDFYSDLNDILPGINFGIFTQNQWTNFSFGKVDDRNIRTNKEIFYDIASLTKTFTASIVLLSFLQQKLDLNDSACKYLDFLKVFPTIKISDLLSHNTGLSLKSKYDKTKNYSVSALEQIFFASENLQIEKKVYSDLNYLYLQKILEKVYNLEFSEILQKFLDENNLSENICFLPITKKVNKNFIAKSENSVDLGMPQDEKARFFGGIAGSSGLFANLLGLEKWAEFWLFNKLNLPESLYFQSFPVYNISTDPKYGLVWRTGFLSNFTNHSGFAGPGMIFCQRKKQILVYTTNYHFPNRSLKNREIFVKKIVELATKLYN